MRIPQLQTKEQVERKEEEIDKSEMLSDAPEIITPLWQFMMERGVPCIYNRLVIKNETKDKPLSP